MQRASSHEMSNSRQPRDEAKLRKSNSQPIVRRLESVITDVDTSSRVGKLRWQPNQVRLWVGTAKELN